MLFILRFSTLANLETGKRTLVELPDGAQIFDLPVAAGQQCRFYLESQKATADVCAGADATCATPLTTLKGNQTNTYVPDVAITQLKVKISSTITESSFLTVHCAIEQIPTHVRTYSGKQKIALFSSIEADVKITAQLNTSQSLKIEGVFYNFDGTKQSKVDVTSTTITTNVATTVLNAQSLPGWLYLDIDPNNTDEYKIEIKQINTNTMEFDKKTELKTHQFNEASVFAQFTAADKQNLTISSFSDRVNDNEKAITVYTDFQLAPKAQTLVSLLRFETTEVTYQIQIKLYQNHFILSKEKVLYSADSEKQYCIIQKNTLIPTYYPPEIDYDFTSVDYQQFTINTKQLYDNKVTGTNPFYAVEFNREINIKVAANGLEYRGLSVTLSQEYYQAMIDDQYSFYTKSGLLYINSSSTQKQIGTFKLDRIYKIVDQVHVGSLQQPINLFYNGKPHNSEKFSICIIVDNKEGVDQDSFLLSASYLYMLPAGKRYMSTSTYFFLNNKNYYCYQASKTENVYFIAEQKKKELGDIPLTIQLGEFQFYLPKIIGNQLTKFDVTKDETLGYQPPLYKLNQFNIQNKKMLFYVEIDTAIESDITLILIDKDKEEIATLEIQKGLLKNSVEVNMSVAFEYTIKIKHSEDTPVPMKLYIGLMYNSPTFTKIPIKYKAEAIIFKYTISEIDQNAVIFTRQDIDLQQYSLYLCPDAPVLEAEKLKQCKKQQVENNQHHSVALPYDDVKTDPSSPIQLSKDFYLILTINEDQTEQKYVIFEYMRIRNLITNIENPITVQPDPLTTRFAQSENTYQIYDLLLHNDHKTFSLLHVDIGVQALNIVLCQQPQSYLIVKNQSQDVCNFSTINSSIIEFQVNFEKNYQRLYLHVFGDAATKAMQQIKVSLYQILDNSKENLTYQFRENGLGRELLNEKAFQIKLKNAKSLEFLSVLQADSLSASEKKTNQSYLIVSKKPDFSDNYEYDGSSLIQYVSKQFPGSNETFYAKIVPKQLILQNISMIFGYSVDQSIINSLELQYMQPVMQNLTLQKNTFNNFRLFQNSVYMEVQLCKASPNTQITLYQSIYETQPTKQTENALQQIINYDGKKAKFWVKIPQDEQIIQQNQNVNLFLGMETNQSEVSYIAMATLGSTAPVIPKDSQVTIQKDKNTFSVKFLPAQIERKEDYGGFLYIPIEGHSYNTTFTVSYSVYQYSNDSTPADAIHSTFCGVQASAKMVSDWQKADESLPELSFNLEASHSAMFIIAARNDLTGEVAVYAASGYSDVQYKVSTGAIVGGAIGGVVGVVAIAVLSLFLVKLQKKSKQLKVVKQDPTPSTFV